METNNAAPLPQRQGRANNQPNKSMGKHGPQKPNDGTDGAPAEKRQRFGPPNQNGGGGPSGPGGPGGAVGGGQNQNKGFNKGGFGGGVGGGGGGNRNRNRGGNQNRPNFQNQSLNQKSNNPDVPKAPDGGNSSNDNVNEANSNPNQSNPNAAQAQMQPLVQAHGHGQNQTFRSRGGGGGPGGGGGGRDNRNRGARGGGGGPMPVGGGGGGGVGGGGGGGSGGIGVGGGGNNNNSMRGDDFYIAQRLRSISGPSHELPPIEVAQETKFSGRNRLYVGNLTNDVTDEELREMFKPYGEVAEIFSNIEKNFTFLKVDYHVNAEKAKRALDGSMRKGRQLRVRFAPNATILRVSNLTPYVSNELLYKAFEIFGPVERASITVDDRGKHMGEGTVEFAKKSSASACLRLCNEKCFFLTASLRPCLVEPMDINDDNDGLPEKALNKKLQEFNQERSIGPRFADLNSFEHEYGSRWKQLHDLHKSKQDALKRELKMEEKKLDAQMEYARYEQETELLRQELRKRESDNERKKLEWDMREKQAEEMRKREEETMRRHQNEMQSHMARQEEDMRRRQQENTLFMQAQQLNSLLDQQEGFGGGGNGGGNGGGGGGNSNFDNFGNSNSPFEVFRGNNSTMVGNNGPGPNNPQDSFAGFDFSVNNMNQGGGNQRGNNGGNIVPWGRRRF